MKLILRILQFLPLRRYFPTALAHARFHNLLDMVILGMHLEVVHPHCPTIQVVEEDNRGNNWEVEDRSEPQAIVAVVAAVAAAVAVVAAAVVETAVVVVVVKNMNSYLLV